MSSDPAARAQRNASLALAILAAVVVLLLIATGFVVWLIAGR